MARASSTSRPHNQTTEARTLRSAFCDLSNTNGRQKGSSKKASAEVRRSTRLTRNPNGSSLGAQCSSSVQPPTANELAQYIEQQSSKRIRERNAAASNTESQSKKRRKKFDRLSEMSCSDNQFCTDEQSFAMNVVSPFDASKFTRGCSGHDRRNLDDAQRAPEYVADIFQRLFSVESNNRLRSYFHDQPELTCTMRMIVIDWLVEVHFKFKLQQATLHLCIQIFDRFLALVQVKKARLQLVAITSLLLASKFEEVFPPSVKDCVYVTDNAYSKEEVLDMEGRICHCLEFRLAKPTGIQFLQRFLSLLEASSTVTSASNYYLDRMLQEPDFLEERSSLLAAASVSLAINHPEAREFDELDENGPGMPRTLLDYTGFSPDEVLRACRLIVTKLSKKKVKLKSSSRKVLFAVKEKYSSSVNNHVAKVLSPPRMENLIDNAA